MPRFSRSAVVLLAVALIAPAAFARSGIEDAESGDLPPLLDRELFFGDPEISNAQLSPNGEYISFIKPWEGTRNVWVKGVDEPYDAARLVTADTRRPIPGYFWTRDSRYVLFVQDQDGDENYNVYAVDPTDEPAEGQDAPTPRNLTDAEGVRAFIYSVPKSRPDTIYVGLNDRDAAWHDLYEVEISSGARKLVRENTDRIAGWLFDLKGELRLAVHVADNGDTEILRVDPDGLTKVYSCGVFETCNPNQFHTDGKRVYMETNKGEDIDLTRLVLFDPASGAVELVEADPEGRVDLGYPIFSSATDELVATAYIDERKRVYYRDEAIEADQKLLEEKLPGREVNVASATSDDLLWLVTAAGDTDPGEQYLFDRRTKELTRQYAVRERIPREHMARMQAIRYASSDGLEIPAYLTLPKGVAPEKLPLILLPHGGPWARDTWGFDGLVQFLANRGYAVLQPNFRASTGYGKAFLNAGNNQWGDRMQDDLTWGVKHLVAEGIVDPKRVGIMGGSYGGYATLAGVAFTPDLYAAAVSIVGPSNLITLLESIPPYWEAARVMFHERMGNPETPEGREQLARQSPLSSAGKIVTPLLVAQGANDPRVKQAESDQIVIALRDRGFPVEYIVAPDEGHGFARSVNSMALFAAAESFLGRHLSSRFQEDATPEVTKRLAEITVDPKTVVLAGRVDADAIGVPEVAHGLTAGTASYQGTIEMGAQSMPISVTRTVEDAGETWVVTDAAKLPMGEALDTCTLEKGSLTLSKRIVKQGPVDIELTFAEGKASGTMSMSGQAKPVSAELGGALFADGAATQDTLAALPLAEGFTTAFRNFDVQQQKVALKQLEVVGREEVAVAAGSFEAWKVRITSAEGEPGETTLWVSEARRVVKTVATIPRMGGAIVTMELQP